VLLEVLGDTIRPFPLWGSRSRQAPLISGFRRLGMIAAVSLRLQYLIFLEVLGLVVPLGAPRHPRTSSCWCRVMRSRCSVEPAPMDLLPPVAAERTGETVIDRTGLRLALGTAYVFPARVGVDIVSG
jgi:hypothetical protein